MSLSSTILHWSVLGEKIIVCNVRLLGKLKFQNLSVKQINYYIVYEKGTQVMLV